MNELSTKSWDNFTAAFEKLRGTQHSHWGAYLGFYSSWLDGYFREPWAMLMPIDDHGFHRGDAVFEAVRIHQGAYFDLQAHLRRLETSARAIGMKLPRSLEQIQDIVVQLAERCASETGTLRLYVTRGPGGFSPSPREVVGHQIYAAITTFKPLAQDFYEKGCRAMFSTVPAKEAFWSQIKSCNYLQNVMMKAECLDRGFDFAISLDASGRLCEGSTENMLLITAEGDLLVPKFDYTLRGTTINIVMKLAEDLIKSGELRSVKLADVTKTDLQNASEAAFVGTTLGVLPITQVEKQTVGTGKVGSRSHQLHQKLIEKMTADPTLRTAFSAQKK